MREHDEWRGDAPRDGDDPALERFAELVAAPLRVAERADATFSARVMDAVRAEAASATARQGARPAARAANVPAIVPAVAPPAAPRRLPWYRRSVTLRVTPLSGLAAAAAVAAVAYLGARATGRGAGTIAAPDRVAAATPGTPAAPLPDTVRVVQFVFVAPGAQRVSLVGDFNAWDREATQLRRGGPSGGVWTVSLALPAGRHEYAFVVDGTRWEPDPAATTAVRDDFGVVSSVVSVGAPRAAARESAGAS